MSEPFSSGSGSGVREAGVGAAAGKGEHIGGGDLAQLVWCPAWKAPAVVVVD